MPQSRGPALVKAPAAATRSSRPEDSSSMHPGTSDPVLTRTQSTAFSGPVLVMLVAIAGFALVEARNLPQWIAWLLPASQVRTHSAADPGLFYWLPVLLVVGSASLLAVMALKAMLRRNRAQFAYEAPRKGFAQPNEIGAKPFRSSRREARHNAMEDVRLRRDARASAAVRAVAAEQLVVVPSRAPRPLEESLPTLPVHPQVRRRDPRNGLPPALVAALQKQIDEGPRARPTVTPQVTAFPAASAIS